jgi:hypothetical protein
MPGWLVVLAWASLSLGLLCALIILLDILAGHRQTMWIMDIVWPVTALWSGPLGLLAYYRVGRLATQQQVEEARRRGEEPPNKKKPFWQMTGEAATHCGAGCTLGDIAAEWIMFFAPLYLLGKGVRGSELYGSWVFDYAWAYTLGILFQYFTIAPMRHLSVGKGIWAAIKADTLSLTAWQVGMYGWMAIVHFLLLGKVEKDSPVFWFMMQIGMLCGFLTAYPVNWLLLKIGWKEKM